jgi:hypothetical protein
MCAPKVTLRGTKVERVRRNDGDCCQSPLTLLEIPDSTFGTLTPFRIPQKFTLQAPHDNLQANGLKGFVWMVFALVDLTNILVGYV